MYEYKKYSTVTVTVTVTVTNGFISMTLHTSIAKAY
jgi:hypothetical protein